MIVAAIGIFVNGGTALMFVRGRKDVLNIEGAYLHMLTDAVVAAGVVVAGYAMKVTQWAWIDPVSSLAIVGLISLGSWKLLRRSFDLAIDAVPDGIESGAVRAFLESRPGVHSVADLHIWGMSTTETALTAHLVMPDGSESGFVSALAHELIHEFGISHSTIQIDQDHNGCSLPV
jgi:cobalt-zinc-cadmium efflux system protein